MIDIGYLFARLCVVSVLGFLAWMLLSPHSNSRRQFTFMPRARTVKEVEMGLRNAGLESCSLILAIDLTRSNNWTGQTSFGGRSLHSLDPYVRNPYQQVIATLGNTLEELDDDRVIPVFGFGDKEARAPARIRTICKGANGFQEALQAYESIIPTLTLEGPTNFAPLIYKAMEIVHQADNSFHILLIVTDGALTDVSETRKAIVDASFSVPLSIIVVGVGDGPWDTMQTFDSSLPERQFDNFTFLSYEYIKREHDGDEVRFAEEALKEVPGQYAMVRDMGMLYRRTHK